MESLVQYEPPSQIPLIGIGLLTRRPLKEFGLLHPVDAKSASEFVPRKRFNPTKQDVVDNSMPEDARALSVENATPSILPWPVPFDYLQGTSIAPASL